MMYRILSNTPHQGKQLWSLGRDPQVFFKEVWWVAKDHKESCCVIHVSTLQESLECYPTLSLGWFYQTIPNEILGLPYFSLRKCMNWSKSKIYDLGFFSLQCENLWPVKKADRWRKEINLKGSKKCSLSPRNIEREANIFSLTQSKRVKLARGPWPESWENHCRMHFFVQ